MKKLLAIVFGLFVLFSSISFAEQNTIDIQGEWHLISLYQDRCVPVGVDDKKGFAVPSRDGVIMYNADGTVTDETEEYSVSRLELSERMVLYYEIQDGNLVGCIFIKKDNDWYCYDILSSTSALFINGRILKNGEEQGADYLYKQGVLFLATGDEYTHGIVEWQGNDAFICNLDEDPFIVEFGDHTVSWGVPFIVGISTFAAK